MYRLAGKDFDEAYKVTHKVGDYYKPVCTPPTCFIGSYPPVTPPGQMGPFFVNTYYLQPNRKAELAGPVTLKSGDITC